MKQNKEEERRSLLSALSRKIDIIGRIRIPNEILLALKLEPKSQVAVTANVEKGYIILTPAGEDCKEPFVRTIDKMGRVVIPKAIRELLKIKDGRDRLIMAVANGRQIFVYKRDAK